MNAHYFLYCIIKVEMFNIFTEFSRLDLGKIKEILDQKAHEVAWGFLNFDSFIQLIENILDLGNLILELSTLDLI